MADPEQFALEDRLGSLIGYVNAGTAALVAELATVLATNAWAVDGVRSPEHFVSWQTGVSHARARRLLALASRHGELPECEALFASGSDLLLMAVPDVFGWQDRINEPATVTDDNWTFRLPWPSDWDRLLRSRPRIRARVWRRSPCRARPRQFTLRSTTRSKRAEPKT